MPVVIPSLNHIFEPLTPPPARKFAPVTHRRFHSDDPAVAHSDNSPPVVRAARFFLAPSRPVSWFAWRTSGRQIEKIAPTAALDVCCGSSRVDFQRDGC